MIELPDIINGYEKIKNFKQPLNISYAIANVLDGDNLTHIKQAIYSSGYKIV